MQDEVESILEEEKLKWNQRAKKIDWHIEIEIKNSITCMQTRGGKQTKYTKSWMNKEF